MPFNLEDASEDEGKVTILLPISEVKATVFRGTRHVEANIPWPTERPQSNERDGRILPYGPTAFRQVRFERVQELLVELHVAASERAQRSHTRRLPEMHVLL